MNLSIKAFLRFALLLLVIFSLSADAIAGGKKIKKKWLYGTWNATSSTVDMGGNGTTEYDAVFKNYIKSLQFEFLKKGEVRIKDGKGDAAKGSWSISGKVLSIQNTTSGEVDTITVNALSKTEASMSFTDMAGMEMNKNDMNYTIVFTKAN